MICPECNGDTPDTSKFCKECGCSFLAVMKNGENYLRPLICDGNSEKYQRKPDTGEEKSKKYLKKAGAVEDNSERLTKKPEAITVLIVDDTTFMRIILRKMLVKFGYNVIGEAVDSEDAVRRYASLRPDVVIMDISMPGTVRYHHGGLDAIKDIIAMDENAKIIVCSALCDRQIVIEALNTGAKGYIVKPFDTKNLVDSINKVFQQAG
jgi:two-component system, chemotaxis family, chemotaxis protein CheY